MTDGARGFKKAAETLGMVHRRCRNHYKNTVDQVRRSLQEGAAVDEKINLLLRSNLGEDHFNEKVEHLKRFFEKNMSVLQLLRDIGHLKFKL